MKKNKRLLSWLLVLTMLTGLFSAGATDNSDVPEGNGTQHNNVSTNSVDHTVSSTQDVVWSSSDTLLATVVEDDCPVLLSAPESVLNGTDVIVNVESTTNSVADGKLTMTYDADKLSFVGVDAGSAWTNEDEVVYSVNHTTGEVVFTFACWESAVRGVLFTLNFTARAEGDATVTLNGNNSYISGAGKMEDQTATIAVEPCVIPVGSYRVVFEQGDHGTMADGAVVVRDVTVGETIGTLPEIEVEFGYVLTGWMIDGTVYTSEEVAAMTFAENEMVTIVAQYTVEALRGDVNYDGIIDLVDLSMVYDYVMDWLKLSEKHLQVADINCDGVVDGTDTNLLYRYLLGVLDRLP